MVMHTLHQRSIRWQAFRQRNPSGNKFKGGISQIQLIEDTFIMIGSKHQPVFLPERFTLSKQTTEICTVGKPICRHLFSNIPYIASFIQIRFRYHPA